MIRRVLLPAGCMAGLLATLVFAQSANKTAPKKVPTKAQAVQVRKAALRAQPSFLGKIVAKLGYRTLVSVEEKKPRTTWLRVRPLNSSVTGWVKQTALHPKPVALRAGANGTVTADATTRSLAGRGFNEQVEQARRSAAEVQEGYRRLDALLARPVFNAEPEDVAPFVAAGKVGGRR